MVLRIDQLRVEYAGNTAVAGVSLNASAGEIVAIIGGNGAGKSSVLRAISGLARAKAGRIQLDGTAIEGLSAHLIARMGVAHVPEGRRLFSKLSVSENLLVASNGGRGKSLKTDLLASVYETFPILYDRRGQRSGTLSGGEQQMLAIGRALMMRPRLLMLDEPSLGIAPRLVGELYDLIPKLVSPDMAMVLVEQDVARALRVSDRAYVLQTGRVVEEGLSKDLRDSEVVRRAYLGI